MEADYPNPEQDFDQETHFESPENSLNLDSADFLFADPALVSRAMVDDVLKYKRLDGVQPFLTALSAALFANGKQTVGIAAALKASKVPTLVIWGASDAIIPAAHAKAADGASVHILSGAGHMVQLEKAGDVNALLKAHFA